MDQAIEERDKIIAALVARLGGRVSFNADQLDRMMAGPIPNLVMLRDDVYRSVTIEVTDA